MYRISNEVECETAARYLGLSDTSASVLAGPWDRPGGCFLETPGHGLLWYDIRNDVACGSQDNQNRYCLCKHGKI